MAPDTGPEAPKKEFNAAEFSKHLEIAGCVNLHHSRLRVIEGVYYPVCPEDSNELRVLILDTVRAFPDKMMEIIACVNKYLTNCIARREGDTDEKFNLAVEQLKANFYLNMLLNVSGPPPVPGYIECIRSAVIEEIERLQSVPKEEAKPFT